MTRIRILAAAVLASASIFAFSAAALAQEAPAAPDNPPAEAEEGEAIIVTGSRIRRPNLESTVPVTSIVNDDFFQRAQNNIGETLNDLPQLRTTVAMQNVGTGIGVAGLNLLDLRGLDTLRTLVLVNGRRHVGSDITNNAVSVDVNTIPSDLVERVDIVTGGNSAIYGSDAIAGVVNFVLKRNFEGVQVRGQASVSDGGFGANQYVSAMYGTKFAEGRGNVIVHGEYYRQERVFASDLDWARSINGFQTPVDQDPGNAPNGSDGVPDRVFLRDQRQSAGGFFLGAVPITQPAGAALCGLGVGSGTGGAGGLAYNCNYIFTPDGRLVPQTGARAGQGITGIYLGGNGPTGREGRLVSVFPFQERYNFNLLANYSFSDALEAFVEAKWVRTNVEGNNSGPSFINGNFAQFDFRERIRLDNPFLSSADSATLAGLISASGCNTSTTQACSGTTTTTGGPLTAAQRSAIAAGTYRFQLLRVLSDIGLRNENFQRDTFRIVGGLRGTFNDDWNYELSVNYGQQKEDIEIVGFLDRQRFMLALDAGRNPATGQIQCRAQFDAASRVAFQRADLTAAENAAIAARLDADVAACKPYNPFGTANNSESIAYFSTRSNTRTKLDQFVVSGFIGGDLSQLFELPGGPVRFALGGEYRRDSALYEQDPFILSGSTNNVRIGLFDTKLEVKEAFAEIQIPILRDMPFFHELTLSGAARVASYGGTVGTVWTYNAGADWAPARDIRFRGNYSRAVRAPNLSETGFPRVPNFANNFADPCRPANIGTGTKFRDANCRADLGALLPNLGSLALYSLPVITGSNPDLEAETSDSYTFGAVFQPEFLPGFALSVDYYDITVNNVIVSLTAQQIADACYDQASLDNPFCGLFERFRGPGTGPFGEQAGQVLGNSLLQAGLNFAKRVRRGIDVNVNYRTNLSDDVRLSTGFIYTHGLKNSNFQNTTDPDFENRLLGELGDPVDEFRWNVELGVGPATIGYQMQYIGPMWLNNYEDFNSLQGRPPQNADVADTQTFPAVFYHNLRFEWDLSQSSGIGRDFMFTVGVENLLNTHPPLGLLGTGSGPGQVGNGAIYNVRGRSFFAGFKTKF